MHTMLGGKRWEEQAIDRLEHLKSLFNTKANQCDIQFQDFVKTNMKTIENECYNGCRLELPISQEEFVNPVGWMPLVMTCYWTVYYREIAISNVVSGSYFS